MCKVTDELVEYGIEIGEKRGIEIGMKGIVLRMAERGKQLDEILADTGVSLELVESWLETAAFVL